jgi:cytochrome c oxidase assembly protein subunit 15
VSVDGLSRVALHRFAVVCVAATFVLIFVGGLVTSTGSALAVPDWPLAFGKLIPPMVGGVQFEWGHRVVAGVVVVLTVILAIWTYRREPRRWVRLTALTAVALILLQALLGGLTVLMLLPLPLAVAHAATAQAFFCVMIAMASFTRPDFGRIYCEPRKPDHPRCLVGVATVTAAAIYVQILIGALMRHLGAGLAIPDFPTSDGRLIPPLYSLAVDVNFAHRCGAVVVATLVIWTFIRVTRCYRGIQPLRSAFLLLVLAALQITLGALTVWSKRAVVPTTTHVAVGAAVLGASVAVLIRAYEVWAASGSQDVASPRSDVKVLARQVSA